MIKFIVIFISFTIISLCKSSITGFVSDSSSGETIVGATVYFPELSKGTVTNKKGLFSIKDIPDGKHLFKITYIGYENYSDTLEFNGDDFRKDFYLISGSVELNEVVVSADAEADKKNITISRVDVPVKQLKEIRIGGEADVFRALQYLPGVLTSSQISNGLYIRGGSPDQNLVQIDGATVYNPSHLFGFISTFNADAVKDVELIKGGFNAEYGGRMSAVLNITQKDGNKKEFHGKLNIGLLSTKLAAEGPLGNGSFYVGGRRTYFELIKPLADNDPENPLPDYNFYDLNFKVNQNIGDNDKLFISAFSSSDFLKFGNFGLDFNLGISNLTGSMKWNHIYNNSLFSSLILSYSKYNNNLNGDNSGFELLVDNYIEDWTIKGKFDWLVSDKLTNKFGFETNFYEFSYLQDFTGDTDNTEEGSESGITNFDINDYNLALFYQSNYLITPDISLQGGLRFTHWDFVGMQTVDPRLAVRYQFNEKISLKAAWGIFRQNLKLATQPNFAFFDTWLGTDTTLNIGRSDHYILSLQTTPFNGYDLNFDLYYKTLNNINELNTTALQIETADDALFEGQGEAFGFEIFLQKKYGKFGGWIGYGFGIINAQFDEINRGNWFHPRYDRRHDFKIVAQYDISPSWNIGMNFTFQGGQPYTDQTSRGQSLVPGSNFGRGKTNPSQRFGKRLPETHFLNINATYNFLILGKNTLLIMDIYNIYNRRDIFFRQFVVEDFETVVQDVKLLPIIPSISFEINF
jgi:hypothetical protein